MKVSGFTFVRNAEKLYIPVRESILSVLPLVDEFIVALGKSDDDTEAIVNSIPSPKIKVLKTSWDTDRYPKNTIYAQQTDVAKQACTGDWLIYIQSDEALHEKDYPEIKSALKAYADDYEVEGLLLNYNHFWGDYEHVQRSHAWYKKEVRIIKNKPEIHSWKDAQSFRWYKRFNEDRFTEYQRSEGNRKLNVVQLKAEVFHYGFVRPPEIMSGKKKRSFSTYHGKEQGEKLLSKMPDAFDYGPLNKIPMFKGTHPKVMKDWIAKFDWKERLSYSGKVNKNRMLHKHEKPKYRVLSAIENTMLGGKPLFDFKNYVLVKKHKHN